MERILKVSILMGLSYVSFYTALICLSILFQVYKVGV